MKKILMALFLIVSTMMTGCGGGGGFRGRGLDRLRHNRHGGFRDWRRWIRRHIRIRGSIWRCVRIWIDIWRNGSCSRFRFCAYCRRDTVSGRWRHNYR